MSGRKRILINGPVFEVNGKPVGEGGKLFLKLQEEGFEVYRVSNIRSKIPRLLHTIFFMLWNMRKYDIVLMQMFGGRAFVVEHIVNILCKLLGKKYYAVIHGGAHIDFYHQYPRWNDHVLKRTDLLITPSKFIYNFFSPKYPGILYIPNFIDTALFPYAPEKPKTGDILWVRAFHGIYKPHFAIRAFAASRKKYPTLTMTMVGPDMGELESCRELMKELNVTSAIRIVGFVPNNELYQYYHSHLIYINSTSFESFGVAQVEAASCGIPMVSTDVGEIPLLWEHGKDMMIVNDNDEAQFSAEIEKLISDGDLRRMLAENAHRKAQQFTWSGVRNQWISLFTN